MFIRNLHRLLPEGSCLFLEGTVVDSGVRDFLRLHQPAELPAIRLGTDHQGYSPPLFHLPVREDLLAGLADLAKKWHEIHQATYSAQGCLVLPQVCDHLKAYKDGQEILVWYDAGDAGMYWFAGASVSEAALRDFCQRVGSTAEAVSLQ